MDTNAMACEAKALQRSFLDEALSNRRAGFRREFDEPIALPNGRDAPPGLRQRRQCVLSCAGR
jgi:hypothetical protein